MNYNPEKINNISWRYITIFFGHQQSALRKHKEYYDSVCRHKIFVFDCILRFSRLYSIV